MDRGRQPLFALIRLDLVAVSPAMFVILNIIIEYKKISPTDLVKISTSWNAGGVQDDQIHLSPATCLITYGG